MRLQLKHLQLKHRPCGIGRNLGLVFFLFQDYGLRRNDDNNLTVLAAKAATSD